MAQRRNRTKVRGWALIAAGLLLVIVTGCGPKRVVHTAPVVEEPADPMEKSVPVAEPAADTPPGQPDAALPDPEFRGATGSSSLETAGGSTTPSQTPPGEPAAQPLKGTRLGLEAADLAQKQLGKPYQWGAAGPDRFDCSGLVMYVYDNLGVKLPRVSGQQAYAGVHVDREDLQPGDLVFFKLNGSRIDHVGIYLGHSKFVHAPRKHMPVRTDTLNDSYWRRRFKGGRRVG